MIISEIIKIIEKIFPLSHQEDYDNSGSQILFPDEKLKSIIFSLDIDNNIIEEAIKTKSNFIITHHPLFFQPLYRICPNDPRSRYVIELIEKKISLYSLHTNLDKPYFDKLGEILGFKKNELLFGNDIVDGIMPVGFGSISELHNPIKLGQLLEIVKKRLSLKFVIYSGDKEKFVSKAALLNGSGGKSIEKIIQNYDIDCIITGDICYHHAKLASYYSIPVIDAGHYGTEKFLMEFLKNELNDYLTNYNEQYEYKLILSNKEVNPFDIYN